VLRCVTIKYVYEYMSHIVSQDSQEMYARPAKRRRTSGSFAAAKRQLATRRVPRNLPGSRSNRCILPLTGSIDFDLTSDTNVTFKFGHSEIVYEGSSTGTLAMPGSTDMVKLFELIRVAKVECTVMPSATGLQYNAQTVSTGQTNIPYLYWSFDSTGDHNGSLNAVQAMAGTTVHLLDAKHTKTIYPRLEGSNGVVDVGVNGKNKFQNSEVDSTQYWRALRLYIDMVNSTWTYGQVRCTFKVFYECISTR